MSGWLLDFCRGQKKRSRNIVLNQCLPLIMIIFLMEGGTFKKKVRHNILRIAISFDLRGFQQPMWLTFLERSRLD